MLFIRSCVIVLQPSIAHICLAYAVDRGCRLGPLPPLAAASSGGLHLHFVRMQAHVCTWHSSLLHRNNWAAQAVRHNRGGTATAFLCCLQIASTCIWRQELLCIFEADLQQGLPTHAHLCCGPHTADSVCLLASVSFHPRLVELLARDWSLLGVSVGWFVCCTALYHMLVLLRFSGSALKLTAQDRVRLG